MALILVTNDDGVHAPGLAALAEALDDLGEVWVVAPEREQSACGHALTLHRPVRVQQVAERRFAVNGTPSDCVNLGVLGFLPERPALVASGINHGSNLGDDVTYSGTVSAAMEGTLLGVPSIAISLLDGGDLAAAGRAARLVAMRTLVEGLPPKTLLNVNVPATAARGMRFTRLGHRVYSEKIVEQVDPRGRTHYWLGARPARVGGARRHRHGRRPRGLRRGHAGAPGSHQPPGAGADGRLVQCPRRPVAAPARREGAERAEAGAPGSPAEALSGSAARESDREGRKGRERERMVEEQLIARGVTDPRVLAVMRRVPRHRFVQEALQDRAYGDHPLPIGEEQTISQPFIVGLMTSLLELSGREKVLEIGTGSGYQTAVLAELARRVCSIERLPRLAERARATLEGMGYDNVWVRVGNGTLGWPDQAPFDRIIVTAGGPSVPPPLVQQLADGGRHGRAGGHAGEPGADGRRAAWAGRSASGRTASASS